MENRIFRIALLLLVIGSLSACIGTDIVDEPLAPRASDITITPGSLSLLEGETAELNAVVTTSSGAELQTGVTWLSRDEMVATVGQLGLIDGISRGQAWIVAYVDEYPNITDSVLCTVVADADEVASVMVTGDVQSVPVGESLQLEASARNVQGDVLMGHSFTWQSSDDAVASVDQTGLVTAHMPGSVNITAESEGVVSAPFSIEVEASAVERSGEFMGQNGYNASGTATLRVQGNNKTLIFSDDFVTQSGPGLVIYLSPQANGVSGGLNLGELQATSGSQTYAIPSSEDTDAYDHVIIYCQPFGVLFGNATLQ